MCNELQRLVSRRCCHVVPRVQGLCRGNVRAVFWAGNRQALSCCRPLDYEVVQAERALRRAMVRDGLRPRVGYQLAR